MTPAFANSRIILALATLLLASFMILIAACGGDDDEADTTAATTAAAEANGDEEEATPTDEPDEGGGNGGSGDAVDACELLTDAEVEEILGVSVQGAPEEGSEPFRTCRWESEGLLLVTVSVFSGSQDEVEALFEIAQENSDAVEGVGDRAHYNDITKGLEVLEGNTDVTVQVVNSEIDEKQAAIDLIEKVLDRLP